VKAELDHVFVCCSVGGGEAAALRRVGLTEGSPNTHPGQGTECRRFFFSNAYLELFWVSDEELALSEAVARTRLFERWSKRADGACPFALILRPSPGAPATAPFPSWPYRPSYMPRDLAIDVALDTPIEGPEFFYLGFQGGRPRSGQEPVDHALGCQRLTGLTVFRPPAGRSAVAAAIEGAGIASFRDADEHRLELRFDAANRGRSDLRPDLPLVLEW
jgi:glyoxalase-like protein